MFSNRLYSRQNQRINKVAFKFVIYKLLYDVNVNNAPTDVYKKVKLFNVLLCREIDKLNT